MKRSGNVSLMLMGGAAFAATFGAGMAYFAWQKPSHAATQQAQSAQSCVPAPGKQTCEPERRGSSYHIYPHYGWSWWPSWGSSETRTRQVALTGGSASSAPSTASGTARNGFGSTGSFHISAGG
jgi:hypothetical protein